ncbi:NAD-binding protein, partial [Chloroflexota bacterium]
VVTMMLTPLAISLVAQLHHRLLPAWRRKGPSMGEPEHKPVGASTNASRRVVIAGYGEVGQSIASGLKEAHIPFIIIEDDPERVAVARRSGHPRIYGDATNINVLSKANLARVSALVVAYPDPATVMTTVKMAQHLNPKVTILARASRKKEAEELKRLGVKDLVIPEREAGYKFVKRLLNVVGMERDERRRILAILRHDAYRQR